MRIQLERKAAFMRLPPTRRGCSTSRCTAGQRLAITLSSGGFSLLLATGFSQPVVSPKPSVIKSTLKRASGRNITRTPGRQTAGLATLRARPMNRPQPAFPSDMSLCHCWLTRCFARSLFQSPDTIGELDFPIVSHSPRRGIPIRDSVDGSHLTLMRGCTLSG